MKVNSTDKTLTFLHFKCNLIYIFFVLKELFFVTRSSSTVAVQTGLVSDGGKGGKIILQTPLTVHIIRDLYVCICELRHLEYMAA